jgi:hypothetical protein
VAQKYDTRRMLGMRTRLANAFRIIAVGIFLSLLFGCAGGKIVRSPIAGKDIYGFIDQNRSDYTMYYSGVLEKPGSIIFDPKNGATLLIGEGWLMIKDGEQIKEAVDNMISVYRKYKGVIGEMGPQLFSILDDKGQEIGYLFTAYDLVENTNTPIKHENGRYLVEPIREEDVRNMAKKAERQQHSRDKSDRAKRLRVIGF